MIIPNDMLISGDLLTYYDLLRVELIKIADKNVLLFY